MAVPTRPVGVADGLPADHPLDLWVVFLLAGGFFVLPWRVESRKALRLALALLVVALLKLSLAATSLPHGLLARYYANADFEGPPEASIEYRLPGATRIDKNLDFAPVGFAWGKKPFPLWFFNDKRRFNYYRPNEPDRQRLPFSVRWEGEVRAPTEEPLLWRLATEQEATLSVEGKPLLSTADGKGEATLVLEGGWHPISVTYVWRGSGPRSLRLEWGCEGGSFEPVPSSALSPAKPSPRAEAWEKRTARVAWGVFALQFLVAVWVVAAGLFGLTLQAFRSERVVLYLLLVVMVAFGTISLAKRGRNPNWNIFNGGDDPLIYETAARQMLIDRDPLNRMEDTQPFYFTAGYRYVVAAIHGLTGPSKAMVVLVQYFLLALTCAPLFYLFKRFAPLWAALFASFMFFAGNANGAVYQWPTDLFPAVTALFVSASMLALLASCGERPSWGRAAGAGVLFGLACALRPNLLPFGPIAVLWLAFNRGRPSRRYLAAAGLVALMAALTISPITLRNWHVSGQFVLLNSGGAINFWQGNEPPEDLDLSRVGAAGLYRLGLDTKTQEVLEYMRQRPAAFLAGLGYKGLHLLGLPPFLSVSLLALHVAYLLGALIHWRSGPDRPLALLLHGFVLSQWALLIVLKPWPHEPKNQLPTFLVAFPFAALFIIAASKYALSHVLAAPSSSFFAKPDNSYLRLSAGLAVVALLIAITYPPRLPIAVALLLTALWTMHRKPSARLFPLDL